VTRSPDHNHFASRTGTAPIDASSGEHSRHRLSRAGNRRLNHVLHIAAVVQLHHDTEGRAYFRRKQAEGKGGLEATRCPKKRLSDAAYRQLVADSLTLRTDHRGGEPGRTPRSDSSIQRGRPDPTRRHFGSATTRTRNLDTNPGTGPLPTPRGLGSPHTTPAHPRGQHPAPHRTNLPLPRSSAAALGTSS